MDANLKATLKKFRQAYDERLKKGQLIPEKSKVAENLLPVSQASGSTQTAPFINQGTATNNNDAQAEVDTGTLGQHLEKLGNVVCVNELLKRTTVNFIGGSISYNEYRATIIYDVSASSDFNLSDSISLIANHKYLFWKKRISYTGNSLSVYFNVTSPWGAIPGTLGNDVNLIYTPTNNQNITLHSYNTSASNGTAIYDIFVIDLTQWFNGNDNIPTDLLAHPDNFFRYYQGSLAYNVGQLLNCNGRYLVNGGQNVLNPSATYNQVVPNRKYNYKGSSTTTITYYDKAKNSLGTESVSNGTQFTTPANCIYIASSVTSATICLYYSGEDYSKDISYVEPKVYDTGNEELLAFDKKTPDGSWHKNTNELTLDSDKAIGSTITLTGAKSDTTKVISKYGALSEWATISGTTLTLTKALSNGDVIQYELATPTTEQGTPFSENMDINDMGNMAWYSAYTDENTNTPVEVPQGCKIFYPAWYVGFVDSLGQKVGWASEKILNTEMTQAEFDSALNSFGYYKQVDLSSGITVATGFTASFKSAYKLGNLVFIDINVRNTSGSTITTASTSPLATVSSDLLPSKSKVIYCDNNSSQARCVLLSNNGNIYLDNSPIANDTVVHITISYAVS